MESMFSGFLSINKPAGITSFSCIRHIKKIIGNGIKIGHSGTLDPFATGLLLIAIGRSATKQLGMVLHGDKTYVVTAKLGELTDTLDCTGRVIDSSPNTVIAYETVLHAVTLFAKTYEQIPPLFSALKFEGRPLYELVRKGKKTHVELENIIQSKKRMVTIKNIALHSYEYPFFTLEVTVSHGTYIRSLVNDIAKTIGTHAVAYTLQRTKLGQFDIQKSLCLQDISSLDDIKKTLISCNDFLLMQK
jgi:tRNA pseudouridine55 synthase